MSYLPGSNSTLQVSLSSRHLGTIVVEVILDAIIAVLALLGNVLVLFIIYRKPSLRAIPNYFVVALAFSDIGMAVLVKPLSIVTLINGTWAFNYETCQYQGYICVFLSSLSLNILTLMAANRYCKIVQSKLHRAYFSSEKTHLYIFLAFVIAVISGLPYSIADQSYEFHPGKYFCYQKELIWPTLYLMCVFLGIPTGIIVFCYVKVFFTIRQHTKNAKRTFQTTFSLKITVEEIRITKTLFTTVVAFLLCWMPVFIVEMIDLTQQGGRLPREVYVMFTLCASASSTVNPIIYGIMNRSFRKEYLDLLRTCGVRIYPDKHDKNHNCVEKSKVDTLYKRNKENTMETSSAIEARNAHGEMFELQSNGVEIVEII